MTVQSTIIKGYTIDLEVDDGVSSCFISKGSYSSSLEFLLGEGYLIDSNDRAYPVDNSIIYIIEEWAYKNGY